MTGLIFRKSLRDLAERREELSPRMQRAGVRAYARDIEEAHDIRHRELGDDNPRGGFIAAEGEHAERAERQLRDRHARQAGFSPEQARWGDAPR